MKGNETMKKMKGKMIFTLVVIALVLCFSMGVAADTQEEDPVDVIVFADVQMDGAFTTTYQMLRVNSYLAESYGYADNVNYTENVSAMDVLVKLHELEYGSAFTTTTCGDYLSLSEYDGIKEAFGITTFDWSIIVNGEAAHTDEVAAWGGYMGLGITQTPIEYSDHVEFVKYQDTENYADHCIWPLDEYGDYIQDYSADVNEDIGLTLGSFPFMTYGTYGSYAIYNEQLAPLSGAQLALLNKDGSLTDIEGAVSDVNGDVSISFDSAGNYTLVAYLPSDNETKAFMAVISVYVYGEGNFAAITDVKEGDWYCDAVELMIENQLMIGTSETSFSPCAHLTRAMFATILYRVAGTPYCTMENPFSDVPDGKWYSDAVVWAYAMGITNGRTATTFDPNGVLTREQMATMIYRFMQIINTELPDGSDVEKYSDDASISPYATEAVYALTRGDILKGIGNNTFAPQQYTTRAHAAQVFYNLVMSK
jgi:hypothetical protein